VPDRAVEETPDGLYGRKSTPSNGWLQADVEVRRKILVNAHVIL